MPFSKSTTPVSATLSKALTIELDALATSWGVTRSKCIGWMLADYLGDAASQTPEASEFAAVQRWADEHGEHAPNMRKGER